MGIKLTTPKFRASFVNVMRPKVVDQESGKKSYQMLCLFEPGEDLKAIRKAIRQAATDKWGAKAEAIIKSGKFKNPIQDQGDIANKDGELYGGMTPGALAFNTTCAEDRGAPTIVDENLDEIVAINDFVSGDYARASVDIFAWEHKTGGRGVSIGLESVQRMGRGEPLGGVARRDVSDAFAPIDLGDDDAEDDDDLV